MSRAPPLPNLLVWIALHPLKGDLRPPAGNTRLRKRHSTADTGEVAPGLATTSIIYYFGCFLFINLSSISIFVYTEFQQIFQIESSAKIKYIRCKFSYLT